jgi:hypothetical protein
MKGLRARFPHAGASTSLGGTGLRPLAADRMRSRRKALDRGFSDLTQKFNIYVDTNPTPGLLCKV